MTAVIQTRDLAERRQRGIAATTARADTDVALRPGCDHREMALMTVATALPDAAQTAAAGVRDLAFAGMGLTLVRQSRPQRIARPTP
jgi:hypothetical protein